MPAGLTKEQQLYVRRVFAELLEKFTQQELEAHLKLDQSRISKTHRDGKTSLGVLVRAAKLAGRPDAEISGIAGFADAIRAEAKQTASKTALEDPKFGTFLLRLGEVPGLRGWLNEHPEGATVSEAWAAVRAYESTPTLSRANDGQPAKGWASFFADLRAGRIGAPVAHEGDASAVLALETSQRPSLPSSTAPKKKRQAKKA